MIRATVDHATIRRTLGLVVETTDRVPKGLLEGCVEWFMFGSHL